MPRVYTYQKCSTCRAATKWLAQHGIAFEELAIRETPPTPAELTFALEGYDGNVKRLFNTSGQDYRALGLKEKLPGLSAVEALELLTQNGNLVKRPFLIDAPGKIVLVGFDPAEWRQALIGR